MKNDKEIIFKLRGSNLFWIMLIIISSFPVPSILFKTNLKIEDIVILVIFIVIMDCVFIYGATLELIIKENEIIRKSKILNWETRIPYSNITEYFKSFWFVINVHTLIFNSNGRTLFLNMNTFHNWKNVMPYILEKANKIKKR